ncbi:Transposase [Arachidicoccus rhizosphaerae]|uniref:Transposase n=1 Tax=Arachidicoccus rhizosphaerae TaxID=551991 RepID=A0A1H3YVH0_9BACT|nr:transposase [Arachidicoccus rhizosphaerae]SEA15397.1 Transposase [Arachidicoccus rhizosphaerae]
MAENLGIEQKDGKRPRFSQQKIMDIVKSIERGATRKEIIDRYELSASTLSGWVRDYASPGYLEGIEPLSASQRRSLVRAVLERGMSIKEAQSAYGLPNVQAVRRYLEAAKREKAELSEITMSMAKNETRAEPISLEDAAALKKALEEAELKIKALNTLIDVAEEQFKIPIRKKAGAKRSKK